jgi:aryl-alcohol dehydrogenase-like predicted oxidoreductase
MYNLVKRQAETEILPMSISESVGVIPYSPLGGGLLSGKYGRKDKPKQGRLMENKMYKVRYGAAWMFETAEKFTSLAKEINVEPAAMAVAWVASHPAVTAPIIGARNPDQLKASLASLNVPMTDALRQRICSFSYEPGIATDRNEEKTAFNYGLR